MKKLSFLTFALGCLATASVAQQAGIQFQDSLTWEQVRAEAKATNKYIFVDCYTTWCGPCKYMAQNIFPLPVVGQYMNDHFISVSVQVDRTQKDGPEIRKWYGEADTMASEYGVSAFPSFLFFAPDGKVVHRFVGALKDPELFISRCAMALDSNKQYYKVVGHYRDHIGDSAVLLNALQVVLSLEDLHSLDSVADAYLSSLKNPFSNETLSLLWRALHSTEGSVFRLFMDSATRVQKITHVDVAFHILLPVVYAQEVSPLVKSGQTLDWGVLSARLQVLCPPVAENAILVGKMAYYRERGEIQGFEEAATRYIDLDSSLLDNWECNHFAWQIFQLSSDSGLLKRALRLSQRSIAHYPNVDLEFLDTYSNLLYKIGNKKEAISWEEKAIALVKLPNKKQEFMNNLHKMQQGVKTWE